MIKSSENMPCPDYQHAYPPATAPPTQPHLKSGQIGFSVQRNWIEKKNSVGKFQTNIFLFIMIKSSEIMPCPD